MKHIWVPLLTCLVIGSIVAGKSDEEHLATLVCKTTSGNKSQLASLSNLNGVIDYLSNLASGHKLEGCRDEYLESLQQLVRVVEADSNDVCGDEKLKLLEDYHRRYISKISKHEKERRKHRNKAPKLAKLFFMQYASRVSSICEQAALQTVTTSSFTISEEKLERMKKLRKFTDILGMTEFSKGYKGIYLFWNMVDALNLDKRDRFAKYLTQSGGIRINLQVKKAKSLVELQAYCRHQLKPFYSKSLLPVLRLVDMGYYPSSDALLESKGHVRDLLYATQVCETILPVGIYPNDSLNGKEVVALTKDETNQMTPFTLDCPTRSFNFTKHAPSSLGLEELSFADTNCEEVKANVTYRSRIISRMLKKMVKRLKNLKMAIKGFKLFHRTQGQKLEEIDEDSLEKMTEQSLQVYEREEAGLVRKKRDFGVIIVTACFLFFIVLLIIGICIPDKD